MTTRQIFLHELFHEIKTVTFTLYKIMIPTLIVVKLLEELGALEYFSDLISPLMTFVGLPESMGIVWATTMMTNLYTGMIVFINIAQHESLTVAQVTVLSLMLLICHALPVEALIAKRAGVKLRVTLTIRIGCALLFAWVFNQICLSADLLQSASQLNWHPADANDTLIDWAISQLKSLAMIFLLICVLLTALKFIRSVGVDKLIESLLAPILKLMGIGRQASTITLIGLTLGLAFGGGLLIQESKNISKRDILASMTLLALCHSIIEDTLLVLLLGANLWGVLFFRLIFSFLLLFVASLWLRRKGDQFIEQHLCS